MITAKVTELSPFVVALGDEVEGDIEDGDTKRGEPETGEQIEENNHIVVVAQRVE